MKTYKQNINKFIKGLENKLTDTVMRSANETITQNAVNDEACEGIERKANAKCCPICADHEKVVSIAYFKKYGLGGVHEACRCIIKPIFQKLKQKFTKKSAEERLKQERFAIINKAKKRADITNLGLSSKVSVSEFRQCLEDMKKVSTHGGAVDMHSVEKLKAYKKLFLSEDKLCGVAIKQNGDITCVFKNPKSKNKNVVHDLLLTARENGGVKLDCYGKTLVNKYEECGFEVVARVKFDPSYVTDDWLLENKPDVFFMVRTKEDTLDVIEKIKNKTFKHSSDEDLMKLPVKDYDEAGAFRDEKLSWLKK